jgi:hypothetical protein
MTTKGAAAASCAVLLALALPTSRPVAFADDAKAGARSNGATCESCHVEIAREWESSLHHRSASDPLYERALTREPLPFCRGCHAPSADPQWSTPPLAREKGTGCTDCHAGLAGEHSSLAAANHPSHPAKACASCHEFAFPNGQGSMQKTASEHRASAFSGTACSSCHMESTGPGKKHRDHRFEVGREMLARALVADVARAGATRVAFRLRPGSIGHAFPTGDLFRRLVVEVEALDEGGNVLARKRRYLSRHFLSKRLPDGTTIRVDGPDSRVGAGLAPCFELDVGPRGDSRAFRIGIAHERVEEPRSGREDDAAVGAHVLIWERILEATPEASLSPCP